MESKIKIAKEILIDVTDLNKIQILASEDGQTLEQVIEDLIHMGLLQAESFFGEIQKIEN